MAKQEIQLIVNKNGFLTYPDCVVDEWTDEPVKHIIVRYPEGDCDCIPWPLTGSWEEDLKSALFDDRECYGCLSDCRYVLLPNGKKVNF